MKKIVLRVFALVMSLFLLCASLTACGTLSILFSKENARPMKLYESAMERMKAWRSVTQSTVSEARVTMLDTEIISFTEETQTLEKTEDDFMHQSESTSTLLVGEESTVTSKKRGYQNGISYYALGRANAIYDRHFQAPLLGEEYLQYYETVVKAESFNLKFNSEDCKAQSCEKNQDGWTGTYSEFTAEYIESSLANMRELKMLLGKEFAVSDLSITIATDKKFNPVHIAIAFEFEAIDKETEIPLPKVKTDIYYTDPDQTEMQAIDLADYREVQDVRVLDMINVWIRDFALGESGKFTTDTFITTHHRYGTGYPIPPGPNDVRISSENGYSFSRADGNFEYAAALNEDNLANETKTRIVYKDGTLSYSRTRGRGFLDEGTQALSQGDAQGMIYSELFPTNFGTKNKISDIKIEQKGYTLYTFTIDDPIEKRELLKKFGDTAKNLTYSAQYELKRRKEDLQIFKYSFDATYEIDGVKYSWIVKRVVAYYSPTTYRTPPEDLIPNMP